MREGGRCTGTIGGGGGGWDSESSRDPSRGVEAALTGVDLLQASFGREEEDWFGGYCWFI